LLTFQDFENAPQKEIFILKAIDEHKASDLYKKAKTSDKYYNGENMITGRNSEITIGDGKLDLAAIRTPSAIFKRLIIQLVQTVWAYGVQLDNDITKKKLGEDFDYIASWISENAALHSVCYGFWNLDKVQMFTAFEYFPLKDERTSEDRAGVRFWQIDPEKPMFVQLYEVDGLTEYKSDGAQSLEVVTPKRAYVQAVQTDAISAEVVGGTNYSALPVIPMYANKRHTSEFTPPIQNKIDLMDFILSGFGDDILRTKVIYWVLQNFGSTLESLKELREKIDASGIIATGDDSVAEAKPIDLPFAAVDYALKKLESDIYLDFMGMQLSEITGGSLTNVAIQTAQYNLSLKASDFM
jgi:Phage portal protein, SPP1 Gp6-like.